MEKFSKIVLVVLLILLVASVQTCRVHYKKSSENENLIESLNDTIKIWRDKDGLSHSKIQIIETTNANSFLKLKIKDKEIIELQEQVKKYKDWLKNQGSITIFTSTTQFDTIYESKIIPSEINDSSFLAEINNEWIQTKFGYRNDSTFYNLKVYNKYSIVLGEEKDGLFKRKSYVEITNYNPYSETTSLRTYQVSQNKKSFSFGPQIGVGFNSDFKLEPYLGIGIQYSLIKF